MESVFNFEKNVEQYCSIGGTARIAVQQQIDQYSAKYCVDLIQSFNTLLKIGDPWCVGIMGRSNFINNKINKYYNDIWQIHFDSNRAVTT